MRDSCRQIHADLRHMCSPSWLIAPRCPFAWHLESSRDPHRYNKMDAYQLMELAVLAIAFDAMASYLYYAQNKIQNRKGLLKEMGRSKDEIVATHQMANCSKDKGEKT